jgi:hypothetical protein
MNKVDGGDARHGRCPLCPESDQAADILIPLSAPDPDMVTLFDHLVGARDEA